MRKRNIFYDLCYGFGIWLVMCFNHHGAAELMRRWADALSPEKSEPPNQ